MKKITLLTIIGLALIILGLCSITNAERNNPMIIDHTCLDLAEIPDEWIDTVQDQIKWHYSHTSHGGQLTTGLQRIEDDDAKYSYARSTSSLPDEEGALCVKDGMTPIRDTYNTPDDYFSADWERPYYVQDLLNLSEYSEINVSSFCFCTQMNSYSEETVNDYLQAMTNLEEDNPEVTFLYFTGNAQTGPGNHYNQNLDQGYNRYLRNEQIRNYCIENNKVLFDFADIDCWWYNTTSLEWELATYEYWNGTDYVDVPYEHPHYNYNQAAHTSYENCENKGKAVWYLMAKLAGWNNTFEIMDIDQLTFNKGLSIRHAIDGDWAAGQNFTPTVSTLTKVEIYMRTLGWPDFDFVIELREEDPTGILLAAVTIPKEEISDDWMWLEFDFEDILVDPDIKYCITVPSAPIGITNSFGYEWAYGFGDLYPDGAFWFNRLYPDDFWWMALPNKYDFSFRTYGYA